MSEKINVTEVISELQLRELEIVQLQSKLESEKTEFRHYAYLMLKNVETEDERVELATQLYWNFPLVKSNDIEIALDISCGAHRYVRNAYIEIPCLRCEKTMVEIEVTSRTKMQEVKAGRLYLTDRRFCGPCAVAKQKEDDGWRQQIREQSALREASIQRLKTIPYNQYLQTDHWKELRHKMLRRAGFKCQLCNGGGQLHVHHRTYERRGNENYADLIVLCAGCHENFHDRSELSE